MVDIVCHLAKNIAYVCLIGITFARLCHCEDACQVSDSLPATQIPGASLLQISTKGSEGSIGAMIRQKRHAETETVPGSGAEMVPQGLKIHAAQPSVSLSPGTDILAVPNAKQQSFTTFDLRNGWSLATDGTLKATESLSADAVFQQDPMLDVGCETCDCSFLGQDNYASPCDIEKNSRAAVAKWVPADSSVLEVGARHGSNSCAIAIKQGQSGKAVAMDADQDVWEVLEKNRDAHGCSFHIAHGLLGRVDGKIIRHGFGTLAAPEDATLAHGQDAQFNQTSVVPHFTFDDLQRQYNLQFDAAVFDCEGCFAIALQDFPILASQLKTLIVEAHDAEELAAVAKLQEQGWELVDAFSRQRILTRK